MANLTFTITSRTGLKAHGTLAWPAKGLSAGAVSGDSNNAAINIGIWTAQRRYLLDKPFGSAYCDSQAVPGAAGHCWFQTLDDQFGRREIGIHPDGGTPDATNGCIGLQTPDTRAWYDAFYAVAGSVTVEVRNA